MSGFVDLQKVLLGLRVESFAHEDMKILLKDVGLANGPFHNNLIVQKQLYLIDSNGNPW